MTDMQIPERKCDAVKFTRAWEPPGVDRNDPRPLQVMLWCEEAMGQRRVHVHLGLGDGPAFVSRHPEETEFFALTHARAGQSRFEWETHPSGCLLGYYVEGANDA